MTRFLYIADTHLGANPVGYHQQQSYPERLPQITAALRKYISSGKPVDFVLHGGDMLDFTSEDNILSAVTAFDLTVPVYLCLGNHDLTTPDALEKWTKLAPQFFINRAPDYTLETEDIIIHVAPNQWCETPYYWQFDQNPHLSPTQKVRLSRQLSLRPDAPHAVLTHSPVFGLPEEQTGLPKPYHAPSLLFTDELNALANEHANLKCILGAHNHMNMHVSRNGVEFVTVSALAETPFEFKLFEVTRGKIEMSTIALGPLMAFEGSYNQEKAFVQGRASDRVFCRTD